MREEPGELGAVRFVVTPCVWRGGGEKQVRYQLRHVLALARCRNLAKPAPDIDTIHKKSDGIR